MQYLTRSVALASLTSVGFWFPTLCLGQSPPAPVVASKLDPIIDQLVEAHNKERAKENLPPLKLEMKLTEAAMVHAIDMAEQGKMTHEGSDESTPEQRVVNAGYRYLKTGENVAVGYKDVADVMLGWMESPGHKKNILGDFTELGVARVLGEDKKPYWCVDFGKPIPRLDPTSAARDLVKRLNEERETAKLAVFVVDEELTKAAQDQAASLAKLKSQGGGNATFDGIDQTLFKDLAMSTANGHPDAEAMTRVLLAKTDLKAQVLGKYSRIGTGYGLSEDGTPYWCLILGNRVATPSKKSRR